MDDILKLFSLCKYSVTITHNDHKDVYGSVLDYFTHGEGRNEIEDDVFNEMCQRDTIVQIQFYPRSAGSFYLVWHYDLALAVKQRCRY